MRWIKALKARKMEPSPGGERDALMAATFRDLRTEAALIRAEIEELQAHAQGLKRVRGEFDHEYRRSRDALERAGGRAPEVEARMKSLDKNQRLTRRDIEKNQRSLDALKRRLAEIEAKIARLEDG